MITKKTVLILGAGASQPYGYPLGEELRRRICNNITNSHNTETLNYLGFKGGIIKKFRDEFLNSGKYTIDEFLEKRTEFVDIGKIAIGLELIPLEHIENLNMVNDSDNWYRVVFKEMDSDIDEFYDFNDFHKNKISFITFNYDRSLEQFMFNALKYSYDLGDENVSKILSKIDIIHLHGQLGFLPWQNKEGRAYSPIIEPNWLKKSAEQIRIIHESSSSDKNFLKTHELLHDAERIYFLGFGFNRTNLIRLNISKLLNSKEISGTSLNLSTFDVKNAEIYSAHNINSNSLIPTNIVNFFRNNHQLI